MKNEVARARLSLIASMCIFGTIGLVRRFLPVPSGFLAMARGLGMPVIAEGVETIEQLEWLRRAGCDMVQGYYYSRPVPAEEIEPLLTAGNLIAPEEEAAPAPQDEAPEAAAQAPQVPPAPEIMFPEIPDNPS